MRVYFFGCWNEPGHFLHAPGGHRLYREGVEEFGDHVHLDGSLAPRRMRDGTLCWQGMPAEARERQRIHYDTAECPQGQFLRHELDTGFTAIQWWDRTQGDTRGACNSTLLAEGRHTSAEMVAMLAEHFPHVVANLERAGVKLVEAVP